MLRRKPGRFGHPGPWFQGGRAGTVLPGGDHGITVQTSAGHHSQGQRRDQETDQIAGRPLCKIAFRFLPGYRKRGYSSKPLKA